MSEESQDVPIKRLNQAQIAWVIASYKRAMHYRKVKRFLTWLIKGIFNSLKWLGESLKWAAPLFVAMYTAWQAGALDGLVGVLMAIKDSYG